MNPTKFVQEYARQVNFANSDNLVFDTKNPSKFSTKQLSLIKALGKPLENFKKAKFNSEVGIYDIEDDLFYDTSTKGSGGVVKRVYNKPRNPTGKNKSVYLIISVHKDPIHYEILDRKNEVLLTDDNDKPLVFINKGKARAWTRQKSIEPKFNTNMATKYTQLIAERAKQINFAKGEPKTDSKADDLKRQVLASLRDYIKEETGKDVFLKEDDFDKLFGDIIESAKEGELNKEVDSGEAPSNFAEFKKGLIFRKAFDRALGLINDPKEKALLEEASKKNYWRKVAREYLDVPGGFDSEELREFSNKDLRLASVISIIQDLGDDSESDMELCSELINMISDDELIDYFENL